MNTETQIMTDKEKRIAIAEACGRYAHSFFCPDCKKNIRYYHPLTKEQERIASDEITGAGYHRNCGAKLETYIPDYLNDLNAMAEAEKTLTDQQRQEYFGHLIWAPYEETKRLRGWNWADMDNDDFIRAMSATAAQRAEAFLMTIKIQAPKL